MLQKQFTIRKANEADINEIVQLRMDFLKEIGMVKCAAESDFMTQKNLTYFQDKMPAKETIVWLIEKGKNVVCTGAVTIFHGPPLCEKMQGEEAYIYNIYTIPDFRRQGLGTWMTQHIIDELKKMKLAYVWLRTSKQGKAIYESLGFASQPKTMDMILVPDAELCY